MSGKAYRREFGTFGLQGIRTSLPIWASFSISLLSLYLWSPAANRFSVGTLSLFAGNSFAGLAFANTAKLIITAKMAAPILNPPPPCATVR